MPNLEDFQPEKRFIGLFCGPSGCGKSGAAASFTMSNYHELDFDMRFGGIYGMVKQGILKNKKISYQQFDRMGGWETVSKEFDRLNIAKLSHKTNPSMYPWPYETIGLGSLGSLSRVILNLARTQMKGHVKVGGLILSSPGDFRAESNGVLQVIDWLLSYPCNIIVTCHLVEKWGKPKVLAEGDEYKPNEIIGEKLNLTDNLSASLLGTFDNVFKFQNSEVAGKIKYEVIFSGGSGETVVAKNSFGIPPGAHDITGKEFYPFFQELIKKYNS